MIDTLDEELLCGSDGEDDDIDDSEMKTSPWMKPFDDLKKQMEFLPSANIYKTLLIEGCGEVMGTRHCRVQWSYNMYTECEMKAFDSSYLQGSKTATTEYGEMLTGVWLALETMRKGEEAQFIIDYKLMYGEMGCPPRIKPKADVLLIAKLVEFTDIGDSKANEELSREDRRKFSVVQQKVTEMQKKSSDHYRNKRFKQAIRLCHSAVQNLEFCRVADEQEQNEQQKLLLQLYTDLMNCYANVQDHRKTCLMINELRRLKNVEKDVAILVNEAIAVSYLEDDEFKRSIEILRRAQKLEPHNKSVNDTLDDIIKKRDKYLQESRQMWQKAMEIKTKVDNKQ